VSRDGERLAAQLEANEYASKARKELGEAFEAASGAVDELRFYPGPLII